MRRSFRGALASLNRPLSAEELESEITFAAPRAFRAIAAGRADPARMFAGYGAHFALMLLARKSWPARRAAARLRGGH